MVTTCIALQGWGILKDLIFRTPLPGWAIFQSILHMDYISMCTPKVKYLMFCVQENIPVQEGNTERVNY